MLRFAKLCVGLTLSDMGYLKWTEGMGGGIYAPPCKICPKSINVIFLNSLPNIYIIWVCMPKIRVLAILISLLGRVECYDKSVKYGDQIFLPFWKFYVKDLKIVYLFV